MAIKCKINGNSRREPDDKGRCPECLTSGVPTTRKGFVGAHDVKLPLAEGPTVPVTDTGSYIGDPRDAMIRRELEGVYERTGARKVEDSAPDPVQTTGHGRAPVLVRGRVMEPFAGDMATRTTQDPTPAPVAGPVHGPIARQTEIPVNREVWAVQMDGVLGSGVDDTRKGWSSQTMNGPTGRERSEPERMHGGRGGWLTEAQYHALTRTQQRKYWAKLKRDRDRAKLERERAKLKRDRECVDTRGRARIARLGTGGTGSHGFASGDSRTTEALMRQKVYSVK